MKIKKNIPLLLFLVMGLTGLGIMLYPTISNYLNEKAQEKLVEEYRRQAEALEQAAYDAMFKQAEAYNSELFASGIDFQNI